MEGLILPDSYKPALSVRETQKAVTFTKDIAVKKITEALGITMIPSPVIVTQASGVNDDLNGVERKVHFTMANVDGTGEVVQSLAKWKRMALGVYGYEPGEGIVTNMSAIRRDDSCDTLHSIYVDQWDWEKAINREDRTVDYLKDTVRKIVGALADVKDAVNAEYPVLKNTINRDVHFITTQELEDLYPSLNPKERENAITKEYGTVFVMQIGDILKSGKKHDGRAPDYDDWKLNGDILLWNEVLNCAEEVSSMGIRVDEFSLPEQLKKAHAEERITLPFHQGIMTGKYPLSIGGGIGQSRVCMFMLEKAHIGEVSVSIWPDEMAEKCKAHGIALL